MTPEEVGVVQTSLRMAIHQLKATYSQKLKQHPEQMANLRAAEAGGPAMGQQPNAQQVQQHMLHQRPHQQQQALAAMSYLNASAGLAGQPPQLVQQRPPSQPQYGLPKPDPGKAPMGVPRQQRPPKAAPGTLAQPRKPVAAVSQAVNAPSPAAAHTPNMGSAPTPSIVYSTALGHIICSAGRAALRLQPGRIRTRIRH